MRHSDLAASKAELQVISENAVVGLVVLDLAENRIVRANREYCCMTGRSEAELLGGLFLSDVIHPDDSSADRRWDAPAKVGDTVHYQNRLLQPDGTVVWVHASSCVLTVRVDGWPRRILATN